MFCANFLISFAPHNPASKMLHVARIAVVRIAAGAAPAARASTKLGVFAISRAK
jgi:hypothetical protein